jgi:hypothetical protein
LTFSWGNDGLDFRIFNRSSSSRTVYQIGVDIREGLLTSTRIFSELNLTTAQPLPHELASGQQGIWTASYDDMRDLYYSVLWYQRPSFRGSVVLGDRRYYAEIPRRALQIIKNNRSPDTAVSEYVTPSPGEAERQIENSTLVEPEDT